MSRQLGALLVALLITACSPLPKAPPPPATDEWAAPAWQQLDLDLFQDLSAQGEGQLWYLPSGQSSLQIQVFSAGSLSRLGHNHIVSTDAISGLLWLADEPAAQQAQLIIPVAALDVDDPELRAAAGPAFASEISGEDRQGTRHNMLGERLLHADAYPWIRIQVRPAAGPDQVLLAVTLKDHRWEGIQPVTWQRDEQRLVLEAGFELDHAALGLTAFSALGGLLQVAETLRLQISIRAQPCPNPKACLASPG